jgi:lipid-A-disaccharide synthase
MLAARPLLQFLVPAAPGLRARIEAAARNSGLHGHLHIVDGQSHAVLAACDTVLLASGTATLEAALFKRPMVIAYRMGTIAWQLMNRKRLQAWVGLPNILCQDFIVPELLQEQATPFALAKEISVWLETPNLVEKVKMRFTDLHKQLTQDTSELVTEAVNKIMASHA